MRRYALLKSELKNKKNKKYDKSTAITWYDRRENDAHYVLNNIILIILPKKYNCT